MTHIQVPMPFKGLHQDAAFSAQPIQTSADLLNVRPYDPISRRRRLSRREGTAKYNANRLSNNPVRFLGGIVTDGRKNTYTGITGSAELNLTTPRATEVRRACMDRQGNLYVIEAFSNITKYNDQGNVVWSFQPPGVDAQHVLCRPFVDLLDNLYVGVVSGGTQTTAKFWRFTQDKGSTIPTKQWEVTPGAFIRNVWVRGDAVYAALNYPDRYGAFVVQYTGALNTGLTEAWRTPVAYPVNDMKLKPDGAVLGCSLPFADRGLDPRYPLFTRKTIDAKIRDVLPDLDRRIWREHKADSHITIYANNESVTLVQDDSGKERVLFTSNRSGSTNPLFNPVGAGGKATFKFRGEISTGGASGLTTAIRDELQTQVSASTVAANAGGMQSLVPSYVGARWVMFLVCRPLEGEGLTGSNASATRMHTAFGQPMLNGDIGSAANSRGSLYFNRTAAGAASSGIGSYVDTVNAAVGAGSGAGNQPKQFDYSEGSGNNCNMVLLAIACDGGNDTLNEGPAYTHSFLRYNGQPIDRWATNAHVSFDQAFVGNGYNTVANEFAFCGDIAYMLVLRDSTTATQSLIGHPIYPGNIGAGGFTANNYATATTGFNATEVEKVEGVIAHEYGMAHLLPRAFAAGAVGHPTQALNYPHPYSLATTGGGAGAFTGWFGPPRATNAGRSEPFVMHSPQGIAWKLDGATGALQWCVTSTVGVEDGGGIGYSINCSNNGEIIYSVGPGCPSGSTTWNGLTTTVLERSSTVARAWVDKNGRGESGFNTSTVLGQKGWIVQNKISFTGASFNGTNTLTGTFTGYVFQAGDILEVTGGTGVTTGSYAISAGNSTTLTIPDIGAAAADVAGYILPSWTTTEIDIDVDDHDNVHIPWNFVAGPTALTPLALFKVYAREPDGSGASNFGRLLLSYDDSTHAKGYCAVCPPSPAYRYGTVPPADFERNPTGSTVAVYARSEFVWIGAAQTGSLPNTSAGLFKVRLVTATPTGDPARVQTFVQVVNGVVAKFTTSTMASFAGPSTLATPQLSTASTYVAGAVAFNKLFLTDGEKYIYVDPINDTVLAYKATDGGKIPERCKLMVNWRGRIVVARGVDSPQQWHMSALGNPFSWNQFPVPRVSTRAISGVNARIGLAPDDINCLIPYSDNTLLFGCDSTIWAMNGDPADEGSVGGFRQVSRTTGMAFGRPWAIDPEGVVYFFGSRGGVWKMSPGSEPVSISDQQIDSLLRDVNLSTYRAELMWDDEYNALRVMFMGTAEVIHYLWDREDGGWWPDQLPFGVETLLTIDGDAPSDRVNVMGCRDGYIRLWNRTGTVDDNIAITSRFLIGPVTPQDARNKWRFRDFRAQLSDTQDPLTMNVYESDTPDDKGTLRLTTVMQPGRNKGKPLSACGPYVWFEGTHSAIEKRWSVESVSVEAIGVGRAHVV